MNSRAFTVAPVVLVALCLWAPGVDHARAGEILVGEGSRLDTGNGRVLLGCGDIELRGELLGQLAGVRDTGISGDGTVETNSLEFSGDWANSGVAQVTGNVRWMDGCGVPEGDMLGNSEFSQLEITSTQGRTVHFETGAIQFVNHSLTLFGTVGTSLILRSTEAGQRGGLALAANGSQSISHVDVADIDSDTGQSLAPGSPGIYASVDSGNNRNWFFGAAGIMPVPSLTAVGGLLLALLTGLLGLSCVRARSQ